MTCNMKPAPCDYHSTSYFFISWPAVILFPLNTFIFVLAAVGIKSTPTVLPACCQKADKVGNYLVSAGEHGDNLHTFTRNKNFKNLLFSTIFTYVLDNKKLVLSL